MVCQVTLQCWGVRSQVDAAEERLKEVFSPGGETMRSHLLWTLTDIRCTRESQPSDVRFGLPHNKNLSSQVLLSPSRDSRTMRLVLRWTRLLVSSAAPPPPHPPLLRLMNISWSRSDSPPPALRSYSQTRTELSLPIAFRWWPCRCALGRERPAHRIRRKRGVYSRKFYTVSIPPGIQGRQGFHSECSCHGITTTT